MTTREQKIIEVSESIEIGKNILENIDISEARREFVEKIIKVQEEYVELLITVPPE